MPKETETFTAAQRATESAATGKPGGGPDPDKVKIDYPKNKVRLGRFLAFGTRKGGYTGSIHGEIKKGSTVIASGFTIPRPPQHPRWAIGFKVDTPGEYDLHILDKPGGSALCKPKKLKIEADFASIGFPKANDEVCTSVWPYGDRTDADNITRVSLGGVSTTAIEGNTFGSTFWWTELTGVPTTPPEEPPTPRPGHTFTLEVEGQTSQEESPIFVVDCE